MSEGGKTKGITVDRPKGKGSIGLREVTGGKD